MYIYACTIYIPQHIQDHSSKATGTVISKVEGLQYSALQRYRIYRCAVKTVGGATVPFPKKVLRNVFCIPTVGQ